MNAATRAIILWTLAFGIIAALGASLVVAHRDASCHRAYPGNDSRAAQCEIGRELHDDRTSGEEK